LLESGHGFWRSGWLYLFAGLFQKSLLLSSEPVIPLLVDFV
jgi:hypothetical protein